MDKSKEKSIFRHKQVRITSVPIVIPKKKVIQELDENLNIYNPSKNTSNSWNNRLEKRYNIYYLA